MSSAMSDMREQLAADEQTSALISALRGTNINDDDNAASGTTLQVVEMRAGDDSLPTEYDPVALEAYFKKRPGAVLTRIGQLTLSGGAWAASTAFKALRGELTSGSKGEVAAVAGLRNVLVSLGPFYIKLGQALSIRPDILSPQAMVQLQQLCDKVPPYDSAIAMQCVREELGVNDVSEVFSTITPEPVAAASLGQVYKATLRASGDEVAVKVQRPFVLETVSLDLHLARGAGQFLRAIDPENAKVTLTSLPDLDLGPAPAPARLSNPDPEPNLVLVLVLPSIQPLTPSSASTSSRCSTSLPPTFTASSTTSSSAPTASASPATCACCRASRSHATTPRSPPAACMWPSGSTARS